MQDLIPNLGGLGRVALIIAVAVGAHLGVRVVKRLGQQAMAARLAPKLSKTRTLVSLITSIVIFSLYFGALGLILSEFGVSLTAYLASASIIGLAIGFGSQGLVQDVVTGLTVIFSDLFDVGEMVEISGQTGIVQRVGVRFTVLLNAFGAEVFIPNRTITNVINYPRGYVRCLADITLSQDTEIAARQEQTARAMMESMSEQFPGILRANPDIEGRQTTSAGKTFLRVKFRIWPGRGAPLETGFRQELTQALKLIDPAYADWMISVNYEVEQKPAALPTFHSLRGRGS